MENNGDKYKVTRENIYYLCYIFEKLSRETFNSKNYLITKFSKEILEGICEAEEAYHVLSSDQVVAEFIDRLGIEYGNWDRIVEGPFIVPYVSQMARTYTRIIDKMVSNNSDPLDNFIKVMESPLADHVDDYSSSLFFHTSEYLAACFDRGEMIDVWKMYNE